MKPPARAIVGNLVWSADGGVWALWRVASLPAAHAPEARRRAVGRRVRGLLDALSSPAMLLSVCARVDPWDVAGDMASGVDLVRHDAWALACEATVGWMEGVTLYRRRDYLAVLLAPARASWRDMLRSATDDVTAVFGISPRPVSVAEVAALHDQAEDVRRELATHVALHPVDAGEVCWLHARALRREAGEPGYDRTWEPAGQMRARTLDAVVAEDRRHVRIATPNGTSYQTVLAFADLPQHVMEGGRPWLHDVDAVGFPVDWCVRLQEGTATVLFSLAASSQDELEARADELMSRYEPREYGLARPPTDQLALLRSTLPGTAPTAACARYRQFLDPHDLAAAGPFWGSALGDRDGLLLGLLLDGGTGSPVHLQPTSLVATGAPGSGVSYLLKRLVWDSVARGAQVVVVDRSLDGEYVRFAEAVPGVVQVVRVDDVDDDGAEGSGEDADLLVLWAPEVVPDDAGPTLLAHAVGILENDPGRDGAVVLDDAAALLADPHGRRAIAEALRRGPRHRTGLWLGCDTPELLVGDDLEGIGGRFVFDQMDDDIPTALALLGFEDDDPGAGDTLAVLDEGLATGRCLLRDSRGRVGHVQVLPPLLEPLQPAFETDGPGLLGDEDEVAGVVDDAGLDEMDTVDEVDAIDEEVSA